MDIAIAALNEVAANAEAQAHPKFESGTSTKNNGTQDRREDVPEGAGHVFPSRSSNDSQTTNADATTPPTSEEYLSRSQELESHLSQLSQLAAAQQPLQTLKTGVPHEALPVATNAGQKRTHDGYRKHSESSSSDGTSTAPAGGHSRNISAISMASSTASTRELASELQTRLKYTMLKINKGWETLPIDEVESLASQQGSPGASSHSTTHGRRNVLTSPRAVIANMQGQAMPSYRSFNEARNVPEGDALSYGEGQPTRTYESFWAQQGQKNGPLTTIAPGIGPPFLAPPLDITATRQSSNIRRLQSPQYDRIPTLQVQTSNHSQNSQGSSGTPTPHTPNRQIHSQAPLKTPTQKSLQEQDAIETLLFMSSPGNSSNMGHTFPPIHGTASQLQSPLRAEFGAPLRGAQGRKVEFIGIDTRGDSDGAGSRPSSSGTTALRNGFRKLRDDEMNQLLDTPADPGNESSDEEIEIIISPRRMAAGRA